MNYDPDALAAFDDEDDEEDALAGLPWNHAARFCGYPGLVWYSESRMVRGDELRIGDCLDTLDHRGCRMIFGIFAGPAPADMDAPTIEHLRGLVSAHVDSELLTVMVGGGETETVRADVYYDVVNPDSQVTPDGTPVVVDEWPAEEEE
jgi:hypothetical protein